MFLEATLLQAQLVILECLGLSVLCHSLLCSITSYTPAHKHPEDSRHTRPTRGVNIAAVTLYFIIFIFPSD